MTNRKALIAGNWKMYKTGPQAAELATRLKSLVSDVTDVDIMVAPAFTALGVVAEILKGSVIHLGGQDLFWEVEGAYTGEISAPMLKAAGCTYVIIGHSERRQYFGETNATVNKKIRAALLEGLIPVMCIGESEAERESNQTFSVVQKQLEEGLQGLTSDEAQKLTLAYEPVWAIGTGKTATTDQAQEVHEFIRKRVETAFGNSVANTIRILYGGSVKPENISDLMAMADIDGALVGGASLDADSFAAIVRF
ncbi:MAG: triose-phosphate isomerase [Deltaproteobacteria bacterium]|nr:triose-phosphate isomerase [Deltaproteobacteria bacterium]MBW2018456.1 triose-phosphate isomerase [Deltaproteobacteria bacterium]MBW2074113.1 triose-phosphate isomerase [Deltaproteobacteria bacterium]RLB83663.1 MAG: triose-phosphate isomerase [Deltaproteobacteria bacterium]